MSSKGNIAIVKQCVVYNIIYIIYNIPFDEHNMFKTKENKQ